jgi:hypothetical protein
MAEELACAFDFGDLRDLKIQLCDGWEDFLITAGRVSCLSRLESLDIHSDYTQDGGTDEIFREFLCSFQGLTRLAVSTYAFWATPDLREAAKHHKATLKAFVHCIGPLLDKYEEMEVRKRR